MALPQVTKGQQEKAVRAVGTETLLSPRCAAAFCFPSGSTSSERKLPTMKKSTLSGNLLSKANLTSCWSLCLIGLGIVPMKYRSFWSGLPRKASVFGAPVREKQTQYHTERMLSYIRFWQDDKIQKS